MKLPAYGRLVKQFEAKGYTRGAERQRSMCIRPGTVGYYIDLLRHSGVDFKRIPKEYLTKEFFLKTLSGCYPEIYDYVESHQEKFDRQFWKDAVSVDYYNILFTDHNIFDIMPDEYLDEEMVMCAMFAAIEMRYAERRDECDGWFYSVYKRKPELLTEELYILGARCFASRRGDENKFLDITPEKYRTAEYYFALCASNRTPVMKDAPKDILTNNFIAMVYLDDTDGLEGFTEDALEREMTCNGKKMKMWQAAVTNSYWAIRTIPLNEERVAYFTSRYDEDSPEYLNAFRDHYECYLRMKERESESETTA